MAHLGVMWVEVGGRPMMEGDKCIHTADSLRCSAETNTAWLSIICQQEKKKRRLRSDKEKGSETEQDLVGVLSRESFLSPVSCLEVRDSSLHDLL